MGGGEGVLKKGRDGLRIGDGEVVLRRVLDALVGGSEAVKNEVEARVGVADGSRLRDENEQRCAFVEV